MGICEDSRLFVLIGGGDGCEEVFAELFGKDAVDLCFDDAASLIDFYDGVVFEEPLADDVGLDAFCGFFNELWIGMYGLSDDVRAFGSEFCRQILNLLSLSFSARLWRCFWISGSW